MRRPASAAHGRIGEYSSSEARTGIDHAGNAAGSEPPRRDAPGLLVRTGASERLRDIWFQATPEFDAALASHFRADYDRAAAGVYGPWRTAPQTCLALIL